MKIVLIGNCQMEKIGLLVPIINNNIKVIYIKLVHIEDQSIDDETNFFNALDESDLIISHRISGGYYKNYVSSDKLLQKYPDKIKFTTNFWFNGYDPSFLYLKKNDGNNINGPIGPTCFYHILEGYIFNFSLDVIYDNWVNMHALQNKSISSTDNSLADLELRDKSLDIKCSHWVLDNFKNILITHTVNHPAIQYLIYQSNCISNYIYPGKGVHLDYSLFSDSYKLNFYSIAPNPFICNQYNIDLKSDLFRGFYIDEFFCNKASRLFNRKEIIFEFLNFLPSLGSRSEDFLTQQYFLYNK